MIRVALRVDDGTWERWLDAIVEVPRLRLTELSAALLAGQPQVLRRLSRDGLGVAHVRDLLPADVSRYLFESPLRTNPQVLVHVRSMLSQARQAGAASACLDVGLERVHTRTFEADLAARVQWLHGLLVPVAGDDDFRLCIPVRLPPVCPGGDDWRRAANLLHDLALPACRLVVDVFPDELTGSFEVTRFLRTHHPHVAALRFHYQPAFGLSPEPAEHAAWAQALRRHSFNGCVVFCVSAYEQDTIRRACARVDDLVPVYGDPAPGG